MRLLFPINGLTASFRVGRVPAPQPRRTKRGHSNSLGAHMCGVPAHFQEFPPSSRAGVVSSIWQGVHFIITIRPGHHSMRLAHSTLTPQPSLLVAFSSPLAGALVRTGLAAQ